MSNQKQTIEQLRQFIAENPSYVSGDDCLETDEDVRETAKMVKDRMEEDQSPAP